MIEQEYKLQEKTFMKERQAVIIERRTDCTKEPATINSNPRGLFLLNDLQNQVQQLLDMLQYICWHGGIHNPPATPDANK